MKKKYLKWVTKWMSEGYKVFMRDGIRRLYSPDEDYTETFECTYTTSDNQELADELIEEEVLDLICDAIREEMKFGDVEINHFRIARSERMVSQSRDTTRITLPVKRK